MTNEVGEHVKVLSPYSHPTREVTRQHINAWIRNQGAKFFDAVVDFDAVLRDPKDISFLASQYDSGDHLHPNERAFEALASYFPIDVLGIG